MPRTEFMDDTHGSTRMGVITSLGVFFLISLLISTSVAPVVSEKLISSPLTSNSRYGVTFPALNYIEDNGKDSVVAVGASILQAALDGSCVSESLNQKDIGVYNLAISGANPYTEMLQIPAVIRANPELVMIDLGPNGLWNFYESDDLNEYIQFRFTINSISMSQGDVGDWKEHIREVDRQWLGYTHLERMNLVQSYSQKASEEHLKGFVSNYVDSLEYEQRAPSPGDASWDDYLMNPYKYVPREPFFEEKNQQEIYQYMEEKMPRKAKQGVYNPQNSSTLNHIAYEYMIEELRSAGIPVLLIATPHHPMVYSYLEPKQLEGFNQTFERYSNLSGVNGINMFWEQWHSSMFRDRNHLGINGREYFCERITPYIDEILEFGGLEENIIQYENIDLSNFLESECRGTDRTQSIASQVEFIQAESYSDCSYGEGIGFQDRWITLQNRDHRGSGYLHALPEDVSQYKGSILGSRLDYNLTFEDSGEYFVWVKMKGNSYGNDTIGMSWKAYSQDYVELETYSSYGWSSEGQWEWEPEFSRPPMSINATAGEDYTLSIWMREDGVMLDEILITNIESLNPKSTDPYSLSSREILCKGSDEIFQINPQGQTFIKAENYTRCEYGQGESIGHEWVRVNDGNSSENTYLHALPDERVHMREDLSGPQLIYDVYFPGNGSYYVWISTRGNSYGNDTVSLSWNLNNTRTETLISSHAWNSEGQWEWEPEGINEPMNITISQPKIIQIIVTMREDGVEFDQLLITTNKDYDPDTED